MSMDYSSWSVTQLMEALDAKGADRTECRSKEELVDLMVQQDIAELTGLVGMMQAPPAAQQQQPLVGPERFLQTVEADAEQGNFAPTTRCLRAGMSPNAEWGSRTALSVAVESGSHDMVMFLLSNGADASHTAVADTAGYTPLHHAVALMDLDMVSILLTAGADPLASDSAGFSALHMAIDMNHNDDVARLLMKCSDVHALTNSGCTVLHVAAAKGRELLAMELLEEPYQVDATVCNKSGDTADRVARRAGHDSTADVIEKVRLAQVARKRNQFHARLVAFASVAAGVAVWFAWKRRGKGSQ